MNLQTGSHPSTKKSGHTTAPVTAPPQPVSDFVSKNPENSKSKSQKSKTNQEKAFGDQDYHVSRDININLGQDKDNELGRNLLGTTGDFGVDVTDFNEVAEVERLRNKATYQFKH